MITLLTVLLTIASGLMAQLERSAPLELVRVDGVVVNSAGKPVSDAAVTLEREGKVLFSGKTDAAGRFEFKKAYGHLLLRVGRTEYAPFARELVVGDDVVIRVEHRKLYIIVGPGACEDECSQAVTSKREFEEILKQKNRH
jgi:hypothetical protein